MGHVEYVVDARVGVDAAAPHGGIGAQLAVCRRTTVNLLPKQRTLLQSAPGTVTTIFPTKSPSA